MKNVQVRFSDEVYRALRRMADEENVSLADVVKKGVQLYEILRTHQKEGKHLAIVDKSGNLYARLVIPGITSDPAAERPVGQQGEESVGSEKSVLIPFAPAHVVAEKLRGLEWPDPDFADDIEKAIKEQPPLEDPRWLD